MIQRHQSIPDPSAPTSHDELDLAKRLAYAIKLIGDSVEIDPDVRGGLPVVRGSRITVSRIFAEIADNQRLSDIADNLDIDRETLRKIVDGISIHLDRPIDA